MKVKCSKCGETLFHGNAMSDRDLALIYVNPCLCQLHQERKRVKQTKVLLNYVCDKIYDWHSNCDCRSVESMREYINMIERFLRQEE